MSLPNYVKGASNGNDANGASLAATFASAVGAGNLVRGYVTWGTAVLTDLNTVTDDKGNTYTIVDKVADGGNVQSYGSFYLENITNAPTIITANFLNTPVVRAIVVGEYNTLAQASAINGHAMILRTNPGTGADAITTGNFTTTQAGDTVTSGILNTSAGPLATVAHGTGFTDEEGDTAATCDLKTEDLTQGAPSATTMGLWTDATNGGGTTYIVGGMAFKSALTAVFAPLMPAFIWGRNPIQLARPHVDSNTTQLNNYILAAAIGVYTYAGSAAKTTATRLLAAATGVYNLTGAAALLAFGHKLLANAGAYTLTGSAASILATRLLAATKGTFTLTGAAAATLYKRILIANTGSFTLTGSAISIARTYVLNAAKGVFSLSGQAANTIYSAASAAVSDWIVRLRRRRR